MKIFRIVFLVLTAVGTVMAQNFEPVGSPLLEQEVLPELANECYIYFDDFTEDTLQLRWQLEEVSFPEGWDIDLCDYGVCYTGIPEAKTMLPAPGLEQPFLKLIVQPGLIAGSGWLWFRVSLAGQSTVFRDVYFSLYTPGVTAVREPETQYSLTVFPNPAVHYFFAQKQDEVQVPARLCDIMGKVVWAGDLSGTQTRIELPGLKPGIYFFETTQIRKTVIIN